ncbi:MAG TPA: pentapeptide repeat-containing protein [Candidatus Angelobacter sp.]|nr:pentapeptide repeat-containing protein [Candidatus Angelobacter sp.]
MAKQEHVNILEKGVAVWNEWRNSNPKTYPDLARAHFGGANLAGAELHGVDLQEATLDFVKADGADFMRLILRGPPSEAEWYLQELILISLTSREHISEMQILEKQISVWLI